MKKLVKLCLALFLILSAMPLNAHAQSDSDTIIINDLIGEARFEERTKHLIKVSLIDDSTGTVHKVWSSPKYCVKESSHAIMSTLVGEPCLKMLKGLFSTIF